MDNNEPIEQNTAGAIPNTVCSDQDVQGQVPHWASDYAMRAAFPEGAESEEEMEEEG